MTLSGIGVIAPLLYIAVTHRRGGRIKRGHESTRPVRLACCQSFFCHIINEGETTSTCNPAQPTPVETTHPLRLSYISLHLWALFYRLLELPN